MGPGLFSFPFFVPARCPGPNLFGLVPGRFTMGVVYCGLYKTPEITCRDKVSILGVRGNVWAG